MTNRGETIFAIYYQSETTPSTFGCRTTDECARCTARAFAAYDPSIIRIEWRSADFGGHETFDWPKPNRVASETQEDLPFD